MNDAIMIRNLFLSLLLMLAGLANGATYYPPVDVKMTVEQVGPHSYYVQGMAGIATDNAGFISNAGFVVTNAGILVFDTLGTPSLAAKMLGLIRQVSDQPIRKVIVSHYHADHIYGLQVFKELGAEIIAPRGAYEYIESANAVDRLEERRLSLKPWVDENTMIVPPDQLVEDTYRFRMGEIQFQIDYFGKAHSTGDLSLLVIDDQVLYSGDIIFESRIPFVGDADTKSWIATLSSLETNDLKALVPGHGPAAKKPLQAIAATRNYLTFLRETMGVAVEEMTAFADVYDATDWSRFEKLPAFKAANRRNAYQVYLSMEAESFD